MDKTLRWKRLLELTRKVREDKKQQDKKIDILCNDMISAHKDFIKKLDTISFTATLYESIIGITDPKVFFNTAGNLIEQQIGNCQIAFFLRTQDSFELYMFENNQLNTPSKDHLGNCFTAELVDNIFKANKICDIEEMFAMGLAGNLGLLKKTSGYSVPLIRFGASVGSVLVYRPKENPITTDELSKMLAVSPGLSKAIESYQAMLS